MLIFIFTEVIMTDKITIADLVSAKYAGRKIAAVSCYDYTTASLVAAADVEMILVGDSAAQTVLGYDSTLPATMDFMVAITAAVRRGAPNVCLTADMPFLSYHLDILPNTSETEFPLNSFFSFMNSPIKVS